MLTSSSSLTINRKKESQQNSVLARTSAIKWNSYVTVNNEKETE